MVTASFSASSRSARSASQPWPQLSLNDDSYEAIALSTRKRIDWPRVLRHQATAKDAWTWLENVRNFSIYTQKNSNFTVLSSGVVHACVHEIMTLLVSQSQQDYEQKMAAMHDKAFKHGTYVADVAVDSDPESFDERGDEPAHTKSGVLSVRSATFAKAGWLSRDETWSYLDETRYDATSARFEKYLTTLEPRHAVTTTTRNLKTADAKQFRDAIAGYLVVPEHVPETEASMRNRGMTVRVQFYAELAAPRTSPFGSFHLPSTKREASVAAIQARLLQIARDCDRLALLVRRRRLGIQVLVDQRRVFPALKARCVKCEQTQFVAKQCRVCGHSVCGDCSDKYERETQVRSHFGRRGGTAKRLESIRVCDPCLKRVESADYSYMSDGALAGPTVFPDVEPKNSIAQSAEIDLKELLHDALLHAPSAQRKSAVMSVIRCVLDQEKNQDADQMALSGKDPHSGPLGRKATIVSLTASTNDDDEMEDAIKALDHLVLPNIPHAEAAIAGQDGRAYPLTPDFTTSYTCPDNEAQRVESIEDLQVLTAGPCDELDLICDLAAKEMGVFASIVSIITQHEMRVVAANNPSFKAITAERAHSFCTHTVMDDKPLIIPHPEADVRVSYTKVATTLGARFYCGFPLVVNGDKVIGTLCCLDQQQHELTESQYTALNRLAQTAAKIIQVRGDASRLQSRGVSPP